MPVVNRPVIPRRPSALEKALDVLRVGVGTAQGVTNIIGGIKDRKLRERGLEAEEARLTQSQQDKDLELAKDFIDLAYVQQWMNTLEGNAGRPPAEQGERLFRDLKDIPFDLSDSKLGVSAAIGSQLAARAPFISPDRPDLQLSQMTWGQLNPLVRDFVQRTYAQRLGVDPSEFKDNELIPTAMPDFREIFDSTQAFYFMQNPEQAKKLVGMNLARTLTGQPTIAAANAFADVTDLRVSELWKELTVDKSPNAYRTLAKWTGLPVTEPGRIIHVDNPRWASILNPEGGGRPFSLEIPQAKYMELVAAAVKEDIAQLYQPSEAKRLNRIAREGFVRSLGEQGLRPEQAMLAVQGVTQYFEVAKQRFPEMTREQWENDPELNAIRQVEQSIRDIKLLSMSAAMQNNNPAWNRLQNTFDFLRKAGLNDEQMRDPKDVKKYVDTLKRLNLLSRERGLPEPFTVPDIQGGGLLFWNRSLDWLGQMHTTGRQDPERTATDVNGVPPAVGVPQQPRSGGEAQTPAALIQGVKDQDRADLMTATPEEREQILDEMAGLINFDGTPFYTDADIAALRAEFPPTQAEPSGSFREVSDQLRNAKQRRVGLKIAIRGVKGRQGAPDIPPRPELAPQLEAVEAEIERLEREVEAAKERELPGLEQRQREGIQGAERGPLRPSQFNPQ